MLTAPVVGLRTLSRIQVSVKVFFSFGKEHLLNECIEKYLLNFYPVLVRGLCLAISISAFFGLSPLSRSFVLMSSDQHWIVTVTNLKLKLS